jgi:subtilase family serine protease
VNRFIHRIEFIFAALVILLSQPPAEARAAGRQQLYGHVPKVVATSPRMGALDPSTQLNLVLSLPLRNHAELQELLKQICDPRSPQYRHFLTPDQFEAKFGPTEEDYQTLVSFAQSNHLNVVTIRPSRRLLEVNGTVEDIQKAFHVSLNHYQRPDGSLFYAPENEPSIDLDVSVLYVGGLDNYQVPKPMLKISAPQAWVKGISTPHAFNAGAYPKATANAGSAPSSLFWGTDFRNAYAPGVCLTGIGQSVALVEFEGYYDKDILGYESLAGLPNVPVTNILIDGFNGIPPRHNTDSNGVIEVSLDIEMAISMAPGLSQVRVYEVKSTAPASAADMMLDQIATDGKTTPINQISCSWSGFGDTASETYFEQFAVQGQAFFQAAGDNGAYVTGDPDTTVPSPINFSSNIEMTVVGGTELAMNGSGQSYLSETTWNAPLAGVTYAGGGGVCPAISIPTYQQGVNMASNGGSTTLRNIPDVSMNADNIFVVADQSYISNSNYSYYTVVGTSAATPLWAGFLALANQQGAGGGVTVGFANPALYTIGLGGKYAADFNDIKDGSTNNLDGTPSLYEAVSGYDLATGWGSPTGQNLINDLTGVPAFACSQTPTVTLAPTQTPTRTLTRTPTNTPSNSPTQTTTKTATTTATPSSTQTTTNTSTPTATITSSDTPTSTPTVTLTATQTNSPSNTFTTTPSPSSTNTVTDTPSDTVTNTQTNTVSFTPTFSQTNTPSITPTVTVSGTPTIIFTATSTATPTDTPSNTFTNTPISASTNTMTNTPSDTATSTQIDTATSTPTFSQTDTPSNTPTITSSGTPTIPPTSTSTGTATNTPSNTLTSTPIPTSTNTITNTPSDTATSTQTNTATSTPTPSSTDTPSNTPTSTATCTPTNSPTSTSTATPTDIPSNTLTNTPIPTLTNTITNTPSDTVTSTETNTVSSTATLSPTNTPSNTPTSSLTDTATPSSTATPISTVTHTATSTATDTPFSTSTDTATNTSTQTATNTTITTSTGTPTNSATDSPTITATSTASNTQVNTATSTPTSTATWTVTNTSSNSATNTFTATQTHTLTPTPTGTFSGTPTFSSTFTPTVSFTETATASSTPMGSETSTVTPTPTSVLLSGGPTPGWWVKPTLSRGGEPIDWQVVLASPSQISLSLYDVAGELVYKTSVHGNAGSNKISWNLQNQSGQKVVSGLYVYFIQIAQGFPLPNPRGKVIVLN